MIRAADYISHFSWPWDEKRWPFYSILLVPGIWLNAPVFWGRILSVFISAGTIILIYASYLKYISSNKKYALLATIFAITSSVFGYWSIRVMADPLFAFLVLLYFYYFFDLYTKKNFRNKEYWLSALLLAITMTRLEGLFVASATGLFFLIYSTKNNKFSFKLKDLWQNFKTNFSSILIFFVPQLLIYFPWTIYAKVLYQGDVNNNYLDEVETFVFNLEHFRYFFTYTAFILVIPVTLYFVLYGFKRVISKRNLYLIPIGLFILQEFLIGLIWTPSLPRIYMAIIPFMAMLLIYGIEVFERTKIDIRKYILVNIFAVFLFIYLQYTQKLYFLGASKLLFVLIIGVNLVLMVLPLIKLSKKFFAGVLVGLNIVITSIIIYNQSSIYKSVMKGIEFVSPLDGKTAYSDETGNTEWYLRSNGFYLNRKNNIDSLGEEYTLLKTNNAAYLLWTDEFNRDSTFIDPKDNPNFELLYVYRQPIRDPLDIVADKLNILDDSDYTVFTTKVYKVR
jgi:4-amino-4-deoxy-L-arabinose transferase-like glycosyltransferase